MRSLIFKIISIPIVLWVADRLLPGIEFANFGQIVMLTLIASVPGLLMEYMFLREGTNALDTLMDFVTSFLVLYIAGNWFTDANVTFVSALIVSAVIGVAEYFNHMWLIKSGNTQKDPA